MASKFGVSSMGFMPMQPRLSARNWSEMRMTMLGAPPGAGVCAEASLLDAAFRAEAALARIGALFSKSRRLGLCMLVDPCYAVPITLSMLPDQFADLTNLGRVPKRV